MSESVRGVKSIKMLGLESFVARIVNAHRDAELSQLAIRKYLDAVCVLLWAIMPVVIPFVTFTVTALLHQHLSVAKVFYYSRICVYYSGGFDL